MAIKEIPQYYEYTCDRCKRVESRKTKTRPPYWVDLRFLQDAYDYQGMAVADGSFFWMLCGDCAKIMIEAIDNAMKVAK
jgi:hypothetical protein